MWVSLILSARCHSNATAIGPHTTPASNWSSTHVMNGGLGGAGLPQFTVHLKLHPIKDKVWIYGFIGGLEQCKGRTKVSAKELNDLGLEPAGMLLPPYSILWFNIFMTACCETAVVQLYVPSI